MMNCHQATRLLSEAQERQLGFKERITLQLHTAMCGACRHFGRQMNMLRLAMHRHAAGGAEHKRGS